MSRVPDKRSVGRIEPFVMRCHVTCGNERRVAYVTDLSPRGARLACDRPPPEGVAVIEIAIRLDGGSATHLQAEVKWVRARAQGKGVMVGVRFVDLSREARARLDAVVEQFRAHAAQLA